MTQSHSSRALMSCGQSSPNAAHARRNGGRRASLFGAESWSSLVFVLGFSRERYAEVAASAARLMCSGIVADRHSTVLSVDLRIWGDDPSTARWRKIDPSDVLQMHISDACSVTLSSWRETNRVCSSFNTSSFENASTASLARSSHVSSSSPLNFWYTLSHKRKDGFGCAVDIDCRVALREITSSV